MVRGRAAVCGIVIAALFAAGLAAISRMIARRVVIVGPSMEPALRDGDRVLVEHVSGRVRSPSIGTVVLARVAAVPGGLTVKRIAGRDPAGGPNLWLLGDNRARSTDSRAFGAVPSRHVLGRVWYRYWPPERRGHL